MNKVISKLNIYDHLGYVLVGLYQIVFLYVLFCLVTQGEQPSLLEFLSLSNSIALIFISYFIGHFVQAVANIFVREEKGKRNDDLGFIFDRAVKLFKLPKKLEAKHVFQYCYLFALSNDFSAHVSLFNAMYSFYRGLFISSVVNLISCILIFIGVFLVDEILATRLNFWFYPLTFSQIFLALLFHNRKERFFKYLEEKVLITFDILSKKKVS